MTEPTTGSDTTKLKTRAEKKGDRYIVNGQKIWTSRAHKSDLMTLLVRTTPLDQVKKRTEGLSVLLVEMKDAVGKGLTMQRIDTMINHQTNALFFDNLEVPAENLIGIEGQGFRYILDSMNSERLVAASQSSGDCRFFINKAVAYSKEREVFGRPIGQNQGIQFPLARCYAEWKAADLMIRAGAALFEAGKSLRRGSQHGKAAGERSRLARRRSLHADAWRICRRTRIRRRAQVARGSYLADRADLDQSHSGLYRPERSRNAAIVLSISRLPRTRHDKWIVRNAPNYATSASPSCSYLGRRVDRIAPCTKVSPP